jgi:hypothetical protein
MVQLTGLVVIVVTGMKKMINAKNKYVLLIGASILLFSTGAFSSPITREVEKYCDLDLNGARISGINYAEMRKLMAWTEDQDEPGWDCFRIVADYKILNEKVKGPSAKVIVEYNVLAHFCSNYELDRNKYREEISVDLVKKNNTWKIKKYILYPRISIEAALTYLNNKVNILKGSGEHESEISKIDQLITNIIKLKQLNPSTHRDSLGDKSQL